jgi:hypothetical protein
MTIDFLMILIFVALVFLNGTLNKIANVLEQIANVLLQGHLLRTRNEDEDDRIILPGMNLNLCVNLCVRREWNFSKVPIPSEA